MVARVKKYKTLKKMMIKSLIGIFIVPLILVWISLVLTSVKTIKETEMSEQQNVTHMLNLSIDKSLLEIQNAVEKLSMDKKVQEILMSIDRYEYNSKLYNANKYINEMIPKAFLSAKGVDNVVLVNFSGGIYSLNAISDEFKDAIQSIDKTKEKIYNNKGRAWVMGDIKQVKNTPVIILAKPIMDLETVKFIGMAYVTYKQSEILKLITSNLTKQVDTIVIDSDNNLIFQNNIAMNNEFYSLAGGEVKDMEAKTAREVYINNQRFILTQSSRNSFGLSVVTGINMNVVTNRLISKQFQIVMIFIVAVVLVYVLTLYIYKRVNIGITSLGQKNSSESSNDAENVNYYELKQVDNKIISLIQKNNEGQEKIVTLVDRCETTTLDKLQAQINPHFLYNTLTSIKYIAIENEQTKISDLITSLVRLLRSTINRDGVFITVEEEVKNVRNYINIQSIVYNDNFKFTCDISDEILKSQIPNFILQPLLENSIFHGIRPDEEGGEIVLKGYEDAGNIVFSIEDNGVGFNDDSLHNIMNETVDGNKVNFTNLGIKGVFKKIQLACGKQYGINVISGKGKGSKVIVTLPSNKK